MRRRHLRTRVLLLTAGFAAALFLITLGLSWRSQRAQERWTQLITVEMKAVRVLEDVVRVQGAFYARFVAGEVDADRYRNVLQMLGRPELKVVDVSVLRARMRAFQVLIAEPSPRPVDLEATSNAVINEARSEIVRRNREIDDQVPVLARESKWMMLGGLAVAWIVVLMAFAATQMTMNKVVRPIEQLAAAAGVMGREQDLNTRAPVAGDKEIAELGEAMNLMAARLRDRARTDELTELPNFRAFRDTIEGEYARARRYGHRFGILVLDLDRFKKYNDTFGHASGNEALKRVAAALRESVRSVDFAARYGGEEFAVILPEVDGHSMHVVAERVRTSIEALPAPPDGAAVTVSIGAALYPDDAPDIAALFESADERLYAAKKGGRNRVVGPAAAGALAG
jgi:diguanylate cyclase (GGDEF)-like protein